MSKLTLIYDGTERAIFEWGLDDVVRTRVSQGPDFCTFVADGRAVDAAELFPYSSTVVVQKDGVPWFFGRVEPWDREGTHNGEKQTAKLWNPWWYLQQKDFQQTTKHWKGWVDGDYRNGPVYSYTSSPHVFLFQSIDFDAHPDGKLTTGEQIVEALQWAIAAGAPIQVGNISPALDVAVEEDKNITCETAILRAMAWHPDCVIWWDYSTDPYPTINISKAEDLPALEVKVSGGRPLNTLRLKERRDWARPFVQIIFEQEVDGMLELITDQWPDPLPGGTENQFRGLVASVALAPWTYSHQAVTLTCNRISAADVTWWKSHAAKLAKLPDANITLDAATAAMSPLDGSAYDPRCTYELTKCQIPPWLEARGILGQRLRVTVDATITAANGQKETETLSYELTATNATGGTYKTSDLTNWGDPVPFGLARSLYDALKQLAVEGSLTNIDEEVSSDLEQWKVLNFITSAQPAWSTVRALPQQIVDTVKTGTTSVTFGAPGHLDPSKIVDLLRMARRRVITTTTNMRPYGVYGAAGGDIALGNDLASSSPAEGAKATSKHVVSDKPNGIGASGILDSTGQTWTLGTTTDAQGTLDPTKGSVKIEVDKCELKQARIRRIHYVDSYSGINCLIRGLVTEPEEDPSPDFADPDNTADDIWLGGGTGGAPVLMAILAIGWQDPTTQAWDYNYWTCVDAKNKTYKVLRPFAIRPTLVYDNIDSWDNNGNHTINGINISYASKGLSRTITSATGAFDAETHLVTPSIQESVMHNCEVYYQQGSAFVDVGFLVQGVLSEGEYALVTGVQWAGQSDNTGIGLSTIHLPSSDPTLKGFYMKNLTLPTAPAQLQDQTGWVRFGFRMIYAQKDSDGNWFDTNNNNFHWAQFPQSPDPGP